MRIVGGLDIHRSQITFDHVDVDTGERQRGRVIGTREAFGCWLDQFPETAFASFAFEGCTGWRYVAEELIGHGFEAHMAEPAEAAALKGTKKRAKTDRNDAEHLRLMLTDGRITESWIPPKHVIDVRIIGRLYQKMMADRRRWLQRIHAQLFQQGAVPIVGLSTPKGRAQLTDQELSPAGGFYVDRAQAMIETLDIQLDEIHGELCRIGRTQPGARAIGELFGFGPLLSVLAWSEMGDTRRFSSSRQAVRYAGLDITVHESAGKRRAGRLSKQGPSTLRYALVEAAQHAAKKTSPDHQLHRNVKQRAGSSAAALTIARKHAKRVHHILRELGDDAWQPT